MANPLILEIKGNSLDDGPGIRSVIFFKGCPLNCTWCHNPESKKRLTEISWDEKKCIDCAACIKVCPKNALGTKNLNFIDRDKCDNCFLCIDECPSKALEKVGQSLDISTVMEKVLPYKSFFDSSGGGVTLSGGEPTLFMDYSSALLEKLNGHDIPTLIETCGHFKFEKFKEKILPFINTIYFDLKIMNKELHKKYCGLTNETILKNFSKLVKLQDEYSFQLLARTPLIPGITDSKENLRAIANFLLENKITKASLLSYNPLWTEKNNKIGLVNTLIPSELTSWMSPEEEKHCQKIFIDKGIGLI